MAQIIFSSVLSSDPAIIAAFVGRAFPDRVVCGDVIINAIGGTYGKIAGLTFTRCATGDDWEAIATIEPI